MPANESGFPVGFPLHPSAYKGSFYTSTIISKGVPCLNKHASGLYPLFVEENDGNGLSRGLLEGWYPGGCNPSFPWFKWGAEMVDLLRGRPRWCSAGDLSVFLGRKPFRYIQINLSWTYTKKVFWKHSCEASFLDQKSVSCYND